MLDNLKLGLIILLTGIVVVFAVLILLIIIIKVYSTGVSNAQSRIEERKVEVKKAKTGQPENTETKPVVEAAEKTKQPDGDSIPGEIIAAIAAAVEVIFGEGAVTVSSVKRAKTQKTSKRRSAWKAAGMAENTRAF